MHDVTAGAVMRMRAGLQTDGETIPKHNAFAAIVGGVHKK